MAVSGGVDSVVLLDVLAKQECRLVVAHVDHGIRPDSAADARFVAALARRYGYLFESCTLSLGARASEERARRERYAFLRGVVAKHGANGLITAHHADDVVETVVLNILRGTGWRGLGSLRSSGETPRPLIHVYKKDILDYALRHRLEWCEDTTNQETVYTRNRIRRQVIPAAQWQDKTFKQKIYQLWQKQCQLRDQLEPALNEASGQLISNSALQKEALLALEGGVALEVLQRFLAAQRVRQTRPQLRRVLAFIRTAGNGKQFSLDASYLLQLRRGGLVVVVASNCYHGKVPSEY